MQLFERGPGPWIQPIKDALREMVIEGQLSASDKEGAAVIARQLSPELGVEETARQKHTRGSA